MMGKSPLAPLKSISIPRLELDAATMATTVDTLLRHNLNNVVTDSIFGLILQKFFKKARSLAGAETAIGASNQALKYTNTMKKLNFCKAFLLLCCQLDLCPEYPNLDRIKDLAYPTCSWESFQSF